MRQNRISASRLYEIAVVLGMAPGDFFEGLSKDGETGAIIHDKVASCETVSAQLSRRELVELNEAFHKVGSPELRQAILKLIQELCRKDPHRTVTGKTAQSSHHSRA